MDDRPNPRLLYKSLTDTNGISTKILRIASSSHTLREEVREMGVKILLRLQNTFPKLA